MNFTTKQGHTEACVLEQARYKIRLEIWEEKYPKHCRVCDGWGGHVHYESHGLPGPREQIFEPCCCLERGVCPRCGAVQFTGWQRLKWQWESMLERWPWWLGGNKLHRAWFDSKYALDYELDFFADDADCHRCGWNVDGIKNEGKPWPPDICDCFDKFEEEWW